MNERMKKTRRLTLISLFVAIELLVGLTPNLGFIRVNVFTITIIHIPVIIGAVCLGPKVGGLLGFVFGLTSFMNATFFNVNPIESPVFTPFYGNSAFPGNAWSLVICFLPRILVGVVAGWLFIALRRVKFNEIVSLSIVGIVGSLTNTVLVLGGIYLFFGQPYAAAYDMAFEALLGAMFAVFTTNGLIEAGIALVATAAIAKALLAFMRRRA